MFFFVFLFFYLYTKHTVYWDIFTSRDIHRALGWLNGQFYWPGPEMSGGNNLPGPFFYFLLFPPLFLGENIYSQSLLWCISWLALTYSLAFSFMGKIIKHKESLLIFLLLFMTAIDGPLLRPLVFAWNPLFALLFHIMAVMSLYYWRETNKNLYLYFLGLVIALGMQVHLLVAVHIITAFFFYFFKAHRKSFLPLCLFIFLATLPVLLYSIMAYFHPFESAFLSPKNSTNYLIFLKSQIFSEQWFRTISKTFSFSIIDSSYFILFLIFWKKWNTKKWPVSQSTRTLFIITAIPCLISIVVARFFWYTYFNPIFLILLSSKCCDDLLPDNSDKKLNYLLVYGLIIVCPLLLFGEAKNLLSFSNLLHTTGNYPVILLFGFILLFLMINTKGTTYKSLGKVCAFFVFLFCVAQMKIIKPLSFWEPSIKKYFLRTWPRHQDLHPLMKKIYLETNWPEKKAVQRIYFVGIHSEVSLLSYYSMTREIIKRNFYDGSLKENNMYLVAPEESQGYMIIQHLQKFTDYSRKDWVGYLSRSSLLSDFLRQEITDKKILIQTPELYHSYWLIPYNTTKESAFVEGFYNIGQPYYWEEPEWLKNCTSTWQFKNKKGFYYCMVLPGHLQRAGVHIRLSESVRVPTNIASPSHLNLDINFFGPLIGSPDCCSNLDGSALWSDIQINLLCGNTYYKQSLPNIGGGNSITPNPGSLASSLPSIGGGNWKKIKKNPALQGQLFTAPLKLRVPVRNFTALSNSLPRFQGIGCKKENIKKIELIFNHKKQQSKVIKKIKVIWEYNQSLFEEL